MGQGLKSTVASKCDFFVSRNGPERTKGCYTQGTEASNAGNTSQGKPGDNKHLLAWTCNANRRDFTEL